MNQSKIPFRHVSACALALVGIACLPTQCMCAQNKQVVPTNQVETPDCPLVKHDQIDTSPFVVNVNDSNYKSEVLDSSQPVIILFVNGWSGQSNRDETDFNDLARRFHTFAKFAVVDIDSSPKLEHDFSCYTAPSMYFISVAKNQTGQSGYINKTQMTNAIEAFLFGRENLIINVNSLPGKTASHN